MHLKLTDSSSSQSPQKEVYLKQLIAQRPGLIVAYSGGVDSSYLAYIAHRVLGDKMLAMLAVGPSLGRKEEYRAVQFLKQHSIPFKIVKAAEIEDPNYRKNDFDRCYYCKKALFISCEDVQKTEGFDHLAYGYIVDDQGDYRPGAQAAKEANVWAPLLEANLTKVDIRTQSQFHDLEGYDRPASPCLASRLVYGTTVTPQALSVVEEMEIELARLGLIKFRARYDGKTLRIEVHPDDFSIILNNREQIVAFARQLDVPFISLDLEGFMSGKLNRLKERV